ncbi:MAG: alpha/beta hydrolase [Gemmatimonadaceae bacterium]
MHTRFAAVLASLLLAPVTLSAQTWADPATWAHVPEPVVTKDIVYFAPADPGYDAKSQRLDVYQNAAATPAAKAPVLVYIHGGAWNHGEKPASWHGFRAWLAAGFSVVSVEYRLVDAAPAPAAVQDARCALSWIKQNADKYSFDTSRVVTYGTSSGGHLAMMAAFLPANNDIDLPQCKAQPHVSAVLDFYGPYHLEASETGAFKSPSTARWMGPDPKPSLEAKEHAMSPSTYIRHGIPPVFIAHGDADPTVPFAASVALKADLDKAGVKNVFDTVPGGGHGKWPPDEQQRVELDSLRFLAAAGLIR